MFFFRLPEGVNLACRKALVGILFTIVGLSAGYAGELSSLSPMGASSGIIVKINGTGFNATASNNEVTFTPGTGNPVTANGSSITSADPNGVRLLSVSVPNGLPIGPAALRVRNKTSNEISEGRSVEIIKLSLPERNSGAQGATNLAIRVDCVGNCQFVAGNSRANFGAGITVVSTTVLTSSSLTATINIAANAVLGTRNVGVLSSTQSAILSGAFTITVPQSNQAPVFGALSNPTLNEGATLNVPISATDSDGDSIALIAANLPGFATFQDNGGGNGTLSLAPNFTHAGSYPISFTATDAKSATANASITVTVNNVNRAPTLNSIGGKSVSARSLISFQVDGVDPDGDILIFAALNLPTGAAFDAASRTFSWTPADNQSGSHNVTFTVSDGVATAQEVVAIQVGAGANRAPTLNNITDQTIAAGNPLSFQISGSDADGDSLTYAASNLPTGALFDAATKTFSWTPQNGQAGDYTVTFSVSDGKETAQQSVKITVTRGANRAPVIQTSALSNALVDQLYNTTIQAQDLDGDALTFSLTQAPTGMTINAASGQLNWTPALSQMGQHSVTVKVEDGFSGSDSKQYGLVVPDTIFPSLTINAPKEAIPGSTFEVTVDATDNVSVSSVTIDVDGQNSQTFSSAPYKKSVVLGTVLTIGSKININAKAKDPSGNESAATEQVTVVGAPDTQPPSITLNAPAQAAPNTQIQLSAIVSDNGGIATTTFYLEGQALGSVNGDSPAINYAIPANAQAGTNLNFSAKAEDFSGNSATSNKITTISTIADTTPPVVNLSVPATLTEGALLKITNQVTDDNGVAKSEIYLNHTLTQSYTGAPPTTVDLNLPAGVTPGMEISVELRASDFSNNQASQTQKTKIVAPQVAGQGVITGEVFDAPTGLPLEGAQITLVKPDGKIVSNVTDYRGRYSFGASEGSGHLTITKAGYNRVDRPNVSVLANAGLDVFDVRLTPLPATGNAISAIFGGKLTAQFSSTIAGFDTVLTNAGKKIGSASLDIPAGVLVQDQAFSFTQISSQGLQGRLPLGWSPIAVVDIWPHGVSFNNQGKISVPNQLNLNNNSGVVLAVWDEATRTWRAVGNATLSSDASTFSMNINHSAQYAFLLPDTVPQVPAKPNAGDLIAGVTNQAVPQSVTTYISPTPKVIFYRPNIKADIGVNVQTSTVLPSGTPLWTKITEEYLFYSKDKIATEPYTQDISFYNFGRTNDTVGAGYPVTPYYVFEPLSLEIGVITVDVIAPPENATSLSLVGPDGTNLTATTGESLIVPANAVTETLAVDLKGLKQTDLGITLPTGFQFVGAISVSLSGNTLNKSAALSIPTPANFAAAGQLLLVRLYDIQGGTRLALAGIAKVNGDRIISSHDLKGDGSVLFDGIRQSGRYLIVQVTQDIGFAGGQVLGTNSAPLGGALVTTSYPIIALANNLGSYVIAAPAGSTTLNAKDIAKADGGSAVVMIPSAGGFVAANISLAAEAPKIVSISPVHGSSNVALTTSIKITFSEPINATSAAGQITLTGPNGSVAGDLSFSLNNTVATFRPTAALAANTQYTVQVSNAIKDLAGYALANSTSATFTSLDTLPPAKPPAGNVNATIPGADGKTIITATQGTAGLTDKVHVLNLTNGASHVVLLNPDGSFSLVVPVTINDRLQLRIIDQAGNESVVDIPRFTQTNADGSVSTAITSEGGKIDGPGGVVVDVPQGAFPDGAVVTVKPITESQYPIQLSAEDKQHLSYSGGITLELGGKTPQKYLNVGVPTLGGETEQDRWVVAQVVELSGEQKMMPIDTARLINNKITTSSPPCPGVTGKGVYGFFRSHRPVGVNYGVFYSSQQLIASTNLPAISGFAMPWVMPTVTDPVISCYPIFGGRVSIAKNLQPAVFGPGNLVLKVVPGTIDPTKAQIDQHNAQNPGNPITGAGVVKITLRNEASGSLIEIPLNLLQNGGLSYSFNDDFSQKYSLDVEYEDGKIFGTAIPTFRITVKNPITGEIVKTIDGQVPPLDQPLDLGFVSDDKQPPTLVESPDQLESLDPSGILIFRFSEAMNAQSLKTRLVVKDELGNVVKGEIRITDGNKTAIFIPEASLALGKSYTISLEGVTDLGGNALDVQSPKTFTAKVFEPTKVSSLDVGNNGRALEPIKDIEIQRKKQSTGETSTIAIATTDSRDGYKLLAIDLSNPEQPKEIGKTFGGFYKKRVTLLQNITLALSGDNPCKPGSASFNGDIAVTTSWNTSTGYVSFFDVTDSTNPCLLGNKTLTATPDALTDYSRPGTYHALGFPRGVVTIEHAGGIAAYAAVGEVGLMPVDIGKNIPEQLPAQRQKEGLYTGDYHDVITAGDRLVAVDKTAQKLEVFDANLNPITAIDLPDQPRRMVKIDGFTSDQNKNGKIDPDEVRRIAYVAGSASIQIVDITNASSPQITGSIPMPGIIRELAVHKEKKLLFAGGDKTSAVGENAFFMIDVSNPQLFGLDANGDKKDDRIIWQVDYPHGINGFRIDEERGLAYVGSQKFIQGVAVGVLDTYIVARPGVALDARSPNGTQISADDHVAYIAASLFKANPGDPSNPTPVDDGTEVEWTLVQGNGMLSTSKTITDKGIAVVKLDTTKKVGDTYVVRATVKNYKLNGQTVEASLISSTAPMVVVPGVASDIALTKSKLNYRSDNTDTIEVEAIIKDAWGNLVPDGTPVSWLLDQSTSSFVTTQKSTLAGRAKATTLAPVLPKAQTVTVSSGVGTSSIVIPVSRVAGSLTASAVSADASLGETISITASIEAANGTPIFWTTSNGSISGDTTVVGGKASATLSSNGGRLGTVVATATIGDRLLYWQGQFTASSGLIAGAEHPVIVAGAPQDSGFKTITWPDGTTHQIPYWSSTVVNVQGPANAIATVSLSGSPLTEAYTFDALVNGSVPGEINGHPMALTGGVIDENEKHLGASLLLDGTSSGTISDAPEFDFTQKMYVSLRVRPSLINSGATLVSKGTAWKVETLEDGKIKATVTNGSGAIYSVTSNKALVASQWSQVSLQVEQASLKLTVDADVAIDTKYTGTLSTNSDPIVLGGGFAGHVDDFALAAQVGGFGALRLDSLPASGKVQLDAQGKGAFVVKSFDTLPGPISGVPVTLHIKVNPEDDAVVQVISHTWWDYTTDAMVSFVGGDPQTGVGIAANVAGGVFIVGDVGSVVKNVWRMAGWSEKEPDYLELSLSGLGLATELAVGVGEVADVPISIARALAARFGKSQFVEILIKRLRKGLTDPTGAITVERLVGTKLLKFATDDDALMQVLNATIKSDEIWEAAIKCHETLGEAFGAAYKKIATEIGGATAASTAKLLGELSDDAIAAIKASPRAEDAMKALGKAVKKGIDPQALKAVIENKNLYTATYKHADLLEDFGAVAEKLTETQGIAKLMAQLTSTSKGIPQLRGYLYELQAAAHFARQGKSIKMSEVVQTIIGNTDIDLIVDGIFVQVKSTTGSLGSSSGIGVIEWILKAKLAGAQKIMYVLPPGLQYTAQIGNVFKQNAVEVIELILK